MDLEAQINLITVPQEFSRLCNALLRAQYGNDFLPIDDDQPDAGNDGYLTSERRMFAMHCFKRPQNQGLERLIRRKMVGDLGKAVALKNAGEWDLDAWTFISNYPVSEKVGADVIRMGNEAGVVASWIGPAELAVLLQSNPSVHARFPALQVNDVSEQLGRLHDRVVELARDLAPEPEVFTGVPRTVEQQARLITTRPTCWEFLLFGGVLLQGREALEFAYLDHKLEIAQERNTADFEATTEAIRFTFHRLADALDPLNKAFQPEPQERAFGPPGKPGDPKAIQHLARIVIDTYEVLLTASEQLRSIEPPQILLRAHSLAIQQIDAPITAIRDFVDLTVTEMERLPARIASGESVELHLDLVLETDQFFSNAFHTEMKRVGRKARWRNWTGLDVDAH